MLTKCWVIPALWYGIKGILILWECGYTVFLSIAMGSLAQAEVTTVYHVPPSTNHSSSGVSWDHPDPDLPLAGIVTKCWVVLSSNSLWCHGRCYVMLWECRDTVLIHTESLHQAWVTIVDSASTSTNHSYYGKYVSWQCDLSWAEMPARFWFVLLHIDCMEVVLMLF